MTPNKAKKDDDTASSSSSDDILNLEALKNDELQKLAKDLKRLETRLIASLVLNLIKKEEGKAKEKEKQTQFLETYLIQMFSPFILYQLS